MLAVAIRTIAVPDRTHERVQPTAFWLFWKAVSGRGAVSEGASYGDMLRAQISPFLDPVTKAKVVMATGSPQERRAAMEQDIAPSELGPALHGDRQAPRWPPA